MALISCPECEHQISSYAVACPNCGFPLAMLERLKSDRAGIAGAALSVASESDAAAAKKAIHTPMTRGSFVTMGSWGGEDIEWFALHCDDEKALVLSVHGIDCRC